MRLWAKPTPMVLNTVESVRSLCQREIGSFCAKCCIRALATPRFPSEFSKNTGDGYMIIFTKPLDAVLFSVKLMQDLIGEGQYKGFHIRIGINYGETIKLPDGDRRGMAVDMAFRIESGQR